MITQDDRNFVNMLFDNMMTNVDTEEIDMKDDDCVGIDELEMRAAELEITVDQLMLDIISWLHYPIAIRTMNEVMLDRWLLNNLDNVAPEWEDDMPEEELSQEAIKLLDWPL